MKKKFLKAPFILTVLSTDNAAFDAPNTTGTGTSVAGAVTINADAGVITTEALTTAAQGVFTLTLTNSKIAANDRLFVCINDYAGTGTPVVTSCTTAAGSSVIKIFNAAAAAAFNAAATLSFQVGKAIA